MTIKEKINSKIFNLPHLPLLMNLLHRKILILSHLIPMRIRRIHRHCFWASPRRFCGIRERSV